MTPTQLKILAFGLFVPGALLMYTFGFFMFVIQRRYIVKRYEVETILAETERLFKGYRSIIVLFPHTRTVFYTTHLLLVMLWSDKTLKKKIHFKDSPSREELLSHFSRKERVLTVITFGCGVLGTALLCTFGFLNWLWSH